MLRAICDWAIFEGKLLNLPELKMPFTFINAELSTEGWNNIPIPLLEAFEIIKETFHNTENIFIATLRETKLRTEGIAKKFKQDLQAAKEREENLKKQVEFLHRKSAETVDQVKRNSEAQLKQVQIQMVKINEAARKDRDSVEKRFELYTKSEDNE